MQKLHWKQILEVGFSLIGWDTLIPSCPVHVYSTVYIYTDTQYIMYIPNLGRKRNVLLFHKKSMSVNHSNLPIKWKHTICLYFEWPKVSLFHTAWTVVKGLWCLEDLLVRFWGKLWSSNQSHASMLLYRRVGNYIIFCVYIYALTLYTYIYIYLSILYLSLYYVHTSHMCIYIYILYLSCIYLTYILYICGIYLV